MYGLLLKAANIPSEISRVQLYRFCALVYFYILFFYLVYYVRIVA